MRNKVYVYSNPSDFILKMNHIELYHNAVVAINHIWILIQY